MANDFTALGSALYSKLGGTAASPAVYYALAPQGSTPPYVIVQRLNAVDEYTFSGEGVSADYVVKVISNRQWPVEAWNAYGTVHSTLQGASLSITGFSALRCERRSTVEYIDPERFWHVGGVYRVEAWAT
jgi:hypothetical protein